MEGDADPHGSAQAPTGYDAQADPRVPRGRKPRALRAASQRRPISSGGLVKRDAGCWRQKHLARTACLLVPLEGVVQGLASSRGRRNLWEKPGGTQMSKVFDALGVSGVESWHSTGQGEPRLTWAWRGFENPVSAGFSRFRGCCRPSSRSKVRAMRRSARRDLSCYGPRARRARGQIPRSDGFLRSRGAT